MRKILFSLMTLVLVVGLVGGGAFAYFSDTETSTGNTFTAGTLDLQFDVDPDGDIDNWQDWVPNYALIYTEEINNMKPGDWEFDILGIKNDGTVDGVVSIEFTNVVDLPGTTPEPEEIFNPDLGELGANVLFTIYYSNDSTSVPAAVTQQSLNALDATGKILLGDLDAGQWHNIWISFEILSTVGNDIMDDNVTFDVVFSLDQVVTP